MLKKPFHKELLVLGAVLMLVMTMSPVSRAEGQNPGKLTLSAAANPLDPMDKAVYYTIAEAAPGEKLTVYVPLVCENTVETVTCLADKTTFPAALKAPASYEAIDAAGNTVVATLGNGQKVYFGLSATVADGAVPGNYVVPMVVNYKSEGKDATPLRADMSIKIKAAVPAVTATPQPSGGEPSGSDSGSSSSGSSGGGSGFRSKPKVIVDAYSFNPEKLYAGERVELKLQLRNTSAKEAVRNMELKFNNDTGVIVPVSGGSNSIYIGEVKKTAFIH